MLKNNNKLIKIVLKISLINLLLYHIPFFKFVVNNLDFSSFSGILTIINLAVLAVTLNGLIFYILFIISVAFGKIVLILFFNINAIAIYFINTYQVMIDKTMIGNIFNTNFEEASSFFSFGLIINTILLGVFPSIIISKIKVNKEPLKKSLIIISSTFLFILAFIYANSSNWLWIDKNSKTLGSLVMPWSYVVNTNRYFYHKSQENKKEILLPRATVKNQKKSIVVLVIGESARSKNFSLYGYKKNTNPLLSNIKNVFSFNSKSCATYTTAGVKCILEHKNTTELYEILPNYLFRNNIEVIWKTTNWGEPPVHIKKFYRRDELLKNCIGEKCQYDELLLNGLSQQILESKKNKILIILHTSTSHGPSYDKKYPKKFNKFMPVCTSVELSKCTKEELINAYDNTIVYTDYILASLINKLQNIKQYSSAMFFVSDHGESLGEKNLYMHGIPASIAPEEQLDIPFIIWLSDNSKKLKNNKTVSQHHVFHSILDFLDIESSIFNKHKSVFYDNKD